MLTRAPSPGLPFSRLLGSLTGELGRASLMLLALRLAGTAMAFAISILLGRVLGPAEYGLYAFGAALLGVMVVPASLGLDNLLAAELPALAAQGRSRAAHGLVATATRLALATALALLALWCLLTLLRPSWLAPELWTAGAIALAALLPLTLLQVRLGALRGQHRVVQGQFPLQVIQPALLLLLAGACLLLAPGSLDGLLASGLLFASFLGACLLALAVLPPLFAGEGTQEPAPAEPWRPLLTRTLPFVVIGGVAVVIGQAGVLLLGALEGPRAAGLYQPAALLAAFVALGHNIINQPLGPRISKLHAEGRQSVLQKTIDRAFLAGFGFGLPLLLLFLVGGDRLLWLFGPEFIAAAPVLALLAVAQMLSVCLGPSALILMMTGRQPLLSRLMAATALVCLLAHLALIPLFGILGAGLAALATTLFWASLSAWFAARRVGLRSSPLVGWLLPAARPA